MMTSVVAAQLSFGSVDLATTTSSFDNVACPFENPILEDAELQRLLQKLEVLASREAYLEWYIAFQERLSHFLSEPAVHLAETSYSDLGKTLLVVIALLKRLRQLKEEGDELGTTNEEAPKCIFDLQRKTAAVVSKLDAFLPANKQDEKEFGYTRLDMASILIGDEFQVLSRLMQTAEGFDDLKRRMVELSDGDITGKDLLVEMNRYISHTKGLVQVIEQLGLKQVMDKSREFAERTNEEIMSVANNAMLPPDSRGLRSGNHSTGEILLPLAPPSPMSPTKEVPNESWASLSSKGESNTKGGNKAAASFVTNSPIKSPTARKKKSNLLDSPDSRGLRSGNHSTAETILPLATPSPMSPTKEVASASWASFSSKGESNTKKENKAAATFVSNSPTKSPTARKKKTNLLDSLSLSLSEHGADEPAKSSSNRRGKKQSRPRSVEKKKKTSAIPGEMNGETEQLCSRCSEYINGEPSNDEDNKREEANKDDNGKQEPKSPIRKKKKSPKKQKNVPRKVAADEAGGDNESMSSHSTDPSDKSKRKKVEEDKQEQEEPAVPDQVVEKKQSKKEKKEGTKKKKQEAKKQKKDGKKSKTDRASKDPTAVLALTEPTTFPSSRERTNTESEPKRSGPDTPLQEQGNDSTNSCNLSLVEDQQQDEDKSSNRKKKETSTTRSPGRKRKKKGLEFEVLKLINLEVQDNQKQPAPEASTEKERLAPPVEGDAAPPAEDNAPPPVEDNTATPLESMEESPLADQDDSEEKAAVTVDKDISKGVESGQLDKKERDESTRSSSSESESTNSIQKPDERTRAHKEPRTDARLAKGENEQARTTEKQGKDGEEEAYSASQQADQEGIQEEANITGKVEDDREVSDENQQKAKPPTCQEIAAAVEGRPGTKEKHNDQAKVDEDALDIPKECVDNVDPEILRSENVVADPEEIESSEQELSEEQGISEEQANKTVDSSASERSQATANAGTKEKEKQLEEERADEEPSAIIRKAMLDAAVNGNYVLAGKLQAEIKVIDALHKEMNDAAGQGNFIRAGELQEQLTSRMDTIRDSPNTDLVDEIAKSADEGTCGDQKLHKSEPFPTPLPPSGRPGKGPGAEGPKPDAASFADPPGSKLGESVLFALLKPDSSASFTDSKLDASASSNLKADASTPLVARPLIVATPSAGSVNANEDASASFLKCSVNLKSQESASSVLAPDDSTLGDSSSSIPDPSKSKVKEKVLTAAKPSYSTVGQPEAFHPRPVDLDRGSPPVSSNLNLDSERGGSAPSPALKLDFQNSDSDIKENSSRSPANKAEITCSCQTEHADASQSPTRGKYQDENPSEVTSEPLPDTSTVIQNKGDTANSDGQAKNQTSDQDDDDDDSDESMLVKGLLVRGSVDYAKVAEQLDSSILDKNLLELMEQELVAQGRVQGLHHLLRRGVFFSHRDLDALLQQLHNDNSSSFYVFADHCVTSESMNVGDLNRLLFCKWLQDAFGVPLVVQLSTNDRFLVHQGNDGDEEDDDDLDRLAQLALENARDIIACGFEYDNTFIFSDLDYPGGMHRNVLRLWKAFSVKGASRMFRLDGNASTAQISLPAIQAAPAFASSFPAALQTDRSTNMMCVIPCTVNEDQSFSRTRDLSHKPVGKNHPLSGRPALLHSKFLPALQGTVGKEISSDTNSTIFVTDSAEDIDRKIKEHAVSGGQRTRAKQWELGADLNRDISFQWLRYFLESEDELIRICEQYGSGRGEYGSTARVKQRLISVLQTLVGEHQKRRSQVTDEQVGKWMQERKIV